MASATITVPAQELLDLVLALRPVINRLEEDLAGRSPCGEPSHLQLVEIGDDDV
jgi:hypothetical protein